MKKHARLGQHFLTSRSTLSLIVKEAGLARKDTVLEIGPGNGVLTEELLKSAHRVVAIEKDRTLFQKLQERFSEEMASRKLNLIEDDVRNLNPADCGLRSGHYKLIANIPYYLTGEILRTFLGNREQPSRMVLLLQREVAARIARSKKESILSVSVKAYGTPRYVCTVKRTAFRPAPKVDSALLVIENISRARFKHLDEQFFFSVVRAGFAQKRKLLMRNLDHFASLDTLRLVFDEIKIEKQARAEDIPLKHWFALAKALKKPGKALV